MPKLTIEEIRKRFESSKEFNEIFDAFEQALENHLEDIELYKLLFWNHSLKPEELCLFGEKIAKEFPNLSFDIYMWLANVFEVTHSVYDNYELALQYYRKAADVKPDSPIPYLQAADCYEADLNIPPINVLIEFLKQGACIVKQPQSIYQKLSQLYEIAGNDEMSKFFKHKTEEGATPPEDNPSQ